MLRCAEWDRQYGAEREIKWETERTHDDDDDDDDWTQGEEQVCLCMRASEQMKMSCRAQLYANFMTLLWVMAVTLFYHLTVSLFISNLHSVFALLVSAVYPSPLHTPQSLSVHRPLFHTSGMSIHPSYDTVTGFSRCTPLTSCLKTHILSYI